MRCKSFPPWHLSEMKFADNCLSSEVYAADIFDTFFRADPLSATQGRKYRYGLLEPGGRRPEMETLLTFLGRKPNPEPFLRSLGIS